MNNIIVFLGPSLSLSEAKRILPDACYFHPVKCGDLLTCLDLNPKIIAIIDGHFEFTAAVWHKEILYCLEKGIEVFGAASMGALRAAELAAFGMVGVGEVYAAYKSGEIIDDDEVAVIHAPAPEFENLCVPMINVRATLKKALLEKVIPADVYCMLLDVAKSIFYPERSLLFFLKKAKDKIKDERIIFNLEGWINNGNYVDVKKEDSRRLLHLLSEKNNEYTGLQLNTNKTIYLRSILREVLCKKKEWQRKNVDILEHESCITALAYLLSAANSIAKKKGEELIDPAENLSIDYFMGMDLLAFIKAGLFNHWSDLYKKVVNVFSVIDNAHLLVNQYFNYLILLKNESVDCILDKNEKFHIFLWTSILWIMIDFEYKKIPVTLKHDCVLAYAKKFKERIGVKDDLSIRAWLERNKISNNDFYNMMCFGATFDYLVLGGNLDLLGVFEVIEDDWYDCALQLIY